MKRFHKYLYTFLILCLFACSAQDKKQSSYTGQSSGGISDVIADLAAEQQEESSAQKDAKQESTPQPETGSDSNVKLMDWQAPVDIDLTGMNATMIYSEVYRMMLEPDDFENKTIRIFGMYTHFYEEQTDRHYYACIVKDAAACCAQGLEFVLRADYSWPDDYPEEGDEVVVTGVFHDTQDGNFKVLMLTDAVIESHTSRTSE